MPIEKVTIKEIEKEVPHLIQHTVTKEIEKKIEVPVEVPIVKEVEKIVNHYYEVEKQLKPMSTKNHDSVDGVI